VKYTGYNEGRVDGFFLCLGMQGKRGGTYQEGRGKSKCSFHSNQIRIRKPVAVNYLKDTKIVNIHPIMYSIDNQ
jgi:hypothetical protein